MTRRLTFDDITLLIAPIIRGDSLGRREAESRVVESLVRQAFGPGAVIVHNADGVPSVEAHGGDHVASLSVSHSRDYACIAFSARRTVGVDVEQPRDQLRRVAPRVLSYGEMNVYGLSDALLLRAWTLKEALYKAALTPGLDFRADIRLPLDPDSTAASVAGRPFDIVTVIVAPDHTLSLVAPTDSSDDNQ